MRVIIVGCFITSFVIIVGIAALVPTYIRARNAEQEQLDTISVFKNNQATSGVDAITEELKADNNILKVLHTTNNRPRPSEAIEDVVNARGNVTITSVSYETISTTTIVIVVQGKAPTRESLLSFKGRLESFSKDTKVELPVSQLASSINIQFALRISYPTP